MKSSSLKSSVLKSSALKSSVLLHLVGVFLISFSFLACEQKEEKAAGDVIQPGVYISDTTEQKSWRDYNKTEKVYARLVVKEDGSAEYTAFVDQLEGAQKSGKYDAARKSLLMKKEGAPKLMSHPVDSITATGFVMQNGPKVLRFSKKQ